MLGWDLFCRQLPVASMQARRIIISCSTSSLTSITVFVHDVFKNNLLLPFLHYLRAIFKTGNGESGNENGERGTGNGESLKRGIFKSGNL